MPIDIQPSTIFYEALPKHKAELINGRLYVGGSLAKSAMALGYMVRGLGARYVADLVPEALLRDAVIEAYGRPAGNPPAMADFSPVSPSGYTVQRLASDLRMGLFMQGLDVWGGTMPVKLGDDVFMPDIYVLLPENRCRLHEYHLEGAPDLAIEVVAPFMRPFDFGTRLDRYAAAGLPEVWMLDWERHTFEPLALVDGIFEKIPVEHEIFVSRTIPGLTVRHQNLFDTAGQFGTRPSDVFEVSPALKRNPTRASGHADAYHYTSMPFSPRFDSDPVNITFDEYISWGGEVKFEMMDGVPVFGGGEQTTREWLALLIMTLGVVEAVKYLPKEDWSDVL